MPATEERQNCLLKQVFEVTRPSPRHNSSEQAYHGAGPQASTLKVCPNAHRILIKYALILINRSIYHTLVIRP
jgi:hypothetical protein